MIRGSWKSLNGLSEIFIDRLINSAKDAELLGKYKIIENLLSPDDAAQLFNKLYLKY